MPSTPLPFREPLRSDHPAMIKFSDHARARISDGIRKYSRIVIQARQRGLNERDTGDIVKAMLGDMLGYDPFFDVTAEISIRGGAGDYAVLAEERLRYIVSVKAANVTPDAMHLLKLNGNAAPPYVDWILLTNADVWSIYRLGVGTDRHAEQVFQTSLLDHGPVDDKIGFFFLLSKEGMQEETLTRYWEEQKVLNPGRLASMLLSDESLNLLRRELLKMLNYRVDRQTLQDVLIREVLRPEALNSDTDGRATSASAPAHCYAYVQNPNDVRTWRFRYRNPDNTPDPEKLMQAVTDLQNGGQSGAIPADDMPLVIDRLRQAFYELDVEWEDLPAALRM